MSPDTKPGYRPDIDGLRAIAVLGVLIFHIHSDLLPGGYAGVDVFFVISGYLITSIIYRQIREEEFSLLNFYSRRIRRIAPAYFVVLYVSLIVGALFMTPEDKTQLAESAVWAAISLPNVYFWLFLDHGYFAGATDRVPLLHLWSLGVEEQFYLLWPTALSVLMTWFSGVRLRTKLLMTLAVAVIASTSLAQALTHASPSFSYYMLPTRTGELLVGAALAVWRSGSTRGSATPWLSHAISLLGLSLILGSYVLLDENTHFPGYAALPPTLGACLVILGGYHNRAAGSLLLSTRPFVFLGLISYSLYLWHWPVLAYYRYAFGAVDLLGAAACVAVALSMAIISWRYVETPFRHSPVRSDIASDSKAFIGYALATLASLAAAGALYTYGSRISQEPTIGEAGIEMVEDRTRPAYDYPYNCQRPRYVPALAEDPICVVGPTGGATRAILLGDSHAAHHIGVLDAFATQVGESIRNLTVSGCPPVVASEHGYGRRGYTNDCSRYRSDLPSLAKPYHLVILGAQWTHYDQDTIYADLERTISLLVEQGHNVLVLGQPPRFARYDRSCEMTAGRLGGVDCRRLALSEIQTNFASNLKLREITTRFAGVEYLDVSSALCDQGACSPYVGEYPAYFDPSHLSMEGSREIGRLMVERNQENPLLIGSGR